eukprot:1180028-Prorocentrum_minimum.AAC.1
MRLTSPPTVPVEATFMRLLSSSLCTTMAATASAAAARRSKSSPPSPSSAYRRRHKRIYPGRGPIRGGTKGYTPGAAGILVAEPQQRLRDQSEEGQENIPGAGTNQRRD